MDFPELHTARLTLRVPRAEDFERYAEHLADHDTARYIGGVQPRAGAWRRFLQMPGAWAVQGFAMFSVIDRHSGRWLGQIGPWRPEGWPGNEIGYSFHRDAWGQGFALEAGKVCVDFAFERLGWDELIHCIDPSNLASIKLAERLGSSHRGPSRLPEPFQDAPVHCWGQTREQWAQRRSASA